MVEGRLCRDSEETGFEKEIELLKLFLRTEQIGYFAIGVVKFAAVKVFVHNRIEFLPISFCAGSNISIGKYCYIEPSLGTFVSKIKRVRSDEVAGLIKEGVGKVPVGMTGSLTDGIETGDAFGAAQLGGRGISLLNRVEELGDIIVQQISLAAKPGTDVPGQFEEIQIGIGKPRQRKLPKKDFLVFKNVHFFFLLR